MTVRRVALEAELQAAEQSLDLALERRHEAEQVLWHGVRSSPEQRPLAEKLESARTAYLEAEERRADAEENLRRLRAELREVRAREARLRAVTGARLDDGPGDSETGRGPSGGLGGWLRSRLERRRRG